MKTIPLSLVLMLLGLMPAWTARADSLPPIGPDQPAAVMTKVTTKAAPTSRSTPNNPRSGQFICPGLEIPPAD